MSARDQLKNLKARFKKAGRVLTNKPTAPQPSSSQHNAQPSSSITPSPPIVPAASVAARPVSPSPAASSASLDGKWTRLKNFFLVLEKGSAVFGPLKVLMGEFIACVEVYENAATARRDYETLKTQLEALFSDLSNHFSGNVPPTMTASMDNLCNAIEKELNSISSPTHGRSGNKRFDVGRDLNDVMECYGRIQRHLERLTLNADLNIWKIVDQQATESRLKEIKPSMSACYNSKEAARVHRRECTPHTREQVLIELSDWRHDWTQGNIFWLNGMAGTGKTTIANSLCVMLDRAHELGASFFCTRLLPECRDVNLILPTIAYQLARFSRPFRCALSLAMEREPDIHHRTLYNQFQGMVLGPLREVMDTLPRDLVVVIDALDECDDNEGVTRILDIILSHAPELPVKIFVSSRPEPAIRDKFGGIDSRLVLHELDETVVKEDIKTYLQDELGTMSISETQFATLVARAGVLFIFAATVVRYVKGDACSGSAARKRLEIVLGVSPLESSKQHKQIDELYHAILSSAFEDASLESWEIEVMELVLKTVVCLREPLTIDALAGLLKLDDSDSVHGALRPLWSVLHINGTSGLVTTLHASFPDYMLDSKRSARYYCHSIEYHGKLAALCLLRISTNRCQFNVCDLESSYVFDGDIPDLDDRVERAIPMDLSYTCRYWAAHLELAGWSSERAELLEGFLSTRLLFWMELLNLKKQIDGGVVSLEKVRIWCMNTNISQDLKNLVYDAWLFLSIFAANPVSLSTPHIYVSMLSAWPKERPVANRYAVRANGLVDIHGTGITRRRLALLSTFAVGSNVTSVAFSPDSKRVVSGSHSGMIHVWDLQSGRLAMEPLKAYHGTKAQYVRSVAFSPDGARIASGSNDRTIRVWDAQRGIELLAPIEGHDGRVSSVAFSSDSSRIASGSDDKSICVWNVFDGRRLLGPLVGHSNAVSSVAFSPNGAYIVSGSHDKTIALWDARSGSLLGSPLEGHTGWVYSVAFSPDSKRIVSGASDKTTRVWDTQTKSLVLGPLDGGGDMVNSVTFSPDGKRIVSGCRNAQLYLWDAQTGQIASEPLEGHTSWVYSVAFAPDGMRIVSSSMDNTICVWDAESAHIPMELLEGHTDRVYSVAFSPDSMRIISSGSTICLWDAQSGRRTLGPLRGHTGWVNSIAVSADDMRIASGSSDKTICVWDALHGQRIFGPLEGHTYSVEAVAFSPDCSLIASGSCDQTVRIWGAHDGMLVQGPLGAHTATVHAVTFSPDSTRVASGSSDWSIRIWDAKTGHVVTEPLRGHTSGITAVAFSPCGTRIVSGSYDHTICLWDTQSGQMVMGPLKGHTDNIYSTVFSPNGRFIASSSKDRTVRLWDVQNEGLAVASLAGHGSTVSSIAFSHDGERIVSASFDKMIRVWVVPHPPGPPAFTQHSAKNWANVTEWYLDEHGWVVDKDKRPLLWVPLDLRARLFMPQNSLLISARGSIHLGFDNANVGQAWSKCYLPASCI